MKISFIIIRVVLLDVKVGLAQRGVGGGVRVGDAEARGILGLEMISDRLEKTL